VEAGRAGPGSSAGLGCAAGGKRTWGKTKWLLADFARWAAAKTGLGGWFFLLFFFLFPILFKQANKFRIQTKI
jgi:hypothetical protein